MKKICFTVAASLLATMSVFVVPSVAKAISSQTPVSDTLPTSVHYEINPLSERAGENRANNVEGDMFWTPERMLNATPLETDHGGPMPSPRSQSTGRAGELNEMPQIESNPVLPLGAARGEASGDPSKADPYIPIVAGKLFLTDEKGKDHVCSASALNTPSKNVIATAAHCVHGGKGGGWYSNIAYVPGYYDGAAPYGVWRLRSVRVFDAWRVNTDWRRDQAFISVWPNGGRNLVDVTGGNGFVWNASRWQAHVRIWGWPAEKPFDGRRPQKCDGATYDATSGDAGMFCGLNGGASGGPWIKDMNWPDMGYLMAVTSRAGNFVQLLYAAPFDKYTKQLWLEMG